jgi:hypothetical protein
MRSVSLPRHPAVAYLFLVRRMKRTCALLSSLFLAATLAGAEQPPLKATVQQLLVTPKKFVGKRVDVTGYYRLGMEDSSLLADERAAKQPWSTDNSIWLDLEIWDPRYHPHRSPNVADPDDVRGRIVRVIGTFRYRKIISADLRSGRRAVLAYGHMGVWPRAIMDITYLRSVR